MKYFWAIGLLVALIVLSTLSVNWINARAEKKLLDAFSKLNEAHEDRVSKLSAVLVGANTLTLDVFIDQASFHGANFWIDTLQGETFVYFEDLIFAFSADGDLTSIKPNSL